MRRYLIFVLLWLVLNAEAQTLSEQLDSAKAAISTSPQRALDMLNSVERGNKLNDNEQMQLWDLLARAYRELGKLALSQQHVDKLQQLATQLQSDSFLARAHRHQAEIHYTAGRYAQAERSNRQALVIYEKLALAREQAIVKLRLSASVRTQGEYWQAIDIAEDALAYFVQAEDSRNIASAYSAIGLAHEFLGNYTQALDALHKTLSEHMRTENEDGIADVLFNIATIYIDTGQRDKAREFLNRALQIDSQAGFKNNIAYDHIRLAELDIADGHFDKARQHAKQAYALFDELGSVRNRGWAKILQGQVEYNAEQYTVASEFFDKGIELATASGDPGLIVSGTMRNAALLVQLKQPQAAIQSIKDAMLNAKQRGDAEQIKYMYDILVSAHEQMGEHDSALAVLRESVQEQEKRANQLRADTIAQLQSSIDHQARQHELVLLEKDNQLAQAALAQTRYQRNLWLIASGLILVIVGVLALNERDKRKLANLREQLLEEAAERKNALLADVSHELRTRLTVLGLHIESLEYDLADNPKLTYQQLREKIQDLNQLISDVYELAKADTGALQFDFTETRINGFLRDVINGHKQLIAKQDIVLSTAIELDDSVLARVDNRRFQQVISNLIRNSIAYTDKPGKLSIGSYVEQGHWVVVLEDSAPGVNSADLSHLFDRLYRCDKSRSRDTGGSGLGLAICKSLVEAHKGTIEAQPSALGGVRISVRVPIHTEVLHANPQPALTS